MQMTAQPNLVTTLRSMKAELENMDDDGMIITVPRKYPITVTIAPEGDHILKIRRQTKNELAAMTIHLNAIEYGIPLLHKMKNEWMKNKLQRLYLLSVILHCISICESATEE